ncbi:MAG: hypothetical protein IH851_06065 [Armatimonadetes bacterium]|nr:hypothetical protein [Armatimonadota bacterium]
MRILVLIMLAALALAVTGPLAGCGGDEEPPATEGTPGPTGSGGTVDAQQPE